MAAEHQYFYEDEVYRINNKGNIEFGMVLENSELVSSDEENSDIDENGPMKKGHIRVAWHPTGEEELIPEKKVGLADRSLMPGDVVRRMVKGKDTQRGYCRNIKVTTCVKVLGSKQVIMNIPSKDLIPLEEYSPDLAVCMDSWVGGIKIAHSKMALRFSDGSSCVVNDPDAIGVDFFDGKRDVVCNTRNILKGCEFPHRGYYYPGQSLYGYASSFQNVDWIHCSKELRSHLHKKIGTYKVSVESILIDSVDIHWHCKAYSKEGAGPIREQPKIHVEGKDLKKLKLLNVFEPCTLQVGDRNFYVFKDGDTVTTLDQWRKIQKEAVLNNTSAHGFQPPLIPCNPASKRRNKRIPFRNSSNLSTSGQVKIYTSSEDKSTTKDSTNETQNDFIDMINNKKEIKYNYNRLSSQPITDINMVLNGNIEKLKQPSPIETSTLNNHLTVNVTLDGNSAQENKISTNDSVKGDEWDTDSGSDFDCYASDTCSNASSTASSTGSASKRTKEPLALMSKILKKKKLRRTRKKAPPITMKAGIKYAVETLSTVSSAEVVWQDGSVEKDIPSTQLYPIHHLDDQEFFPGDFVIENREDSCMRLYGVVQSVDHFGRTANVKWFRTYHNTNNPQPSFLQENEVSVYDLKDHPDFQYRPGTVVIRVANFEGEDENCTAGQVLDNYPEGKVLVWWVDGHVSMCWPQDLYKVGEYDSDEGELWDDSSSSSSSGSSWETESEDLCSAGGEDVAESKDDETLRPKLAYNIEKARVAMSRLEKIFTQNPALQTTDVMKKLMDVYKDCRYLDKLMGTTFFHEKHFQGLLERVRERGKTNMAQRVADQVSRLFNQTDETDPMQHLEPVTGDGEVESQQASESSNSDSGVVIGSPLNSKDLKSGEFLNENLANLEMDMVTAVQNSKNLNMGEQRNSIAEEMKKILKNLTEDVEEMANKRHSNKSENCNEISLPPKESCAKMETDEPGKTGIPVSSGSSCWDENSSNAATNVNSHVCAKLCSMILAQLVKAHAEVVKRFDVHTQDIMTLSDAANTLSPTGSIGPEDTSSIKQNNVINGDNGVVEEKKEDNVETSNSNRRAEVTLDNGLVNNTCDIATSNCIIPQEGEGFSILDTAPNNHRYKLTMFQPTDQKTFFKTVRNEIKLLRTSLPQGIWVKGFEDRMDLYSVMIRGPEKTPYEDGLFCFDFQLSADYPKAPPVCHYISYCSDRLNPNLYEDGKVCVSLLGTWSGKGTEVWTLTSNLLQVIVSIQGLILVNEPYFNEAGYEKQKGTQQGRENSRMYNEMVVLKLVQSMTKLLLNPPTIFKEHIMEHFSKNAEKFCARLTSWLEISERYNATHPLSPTTPDTFKDIQGNEVNGIPLPEFPLIPASKGFCLTLKKSLVTFKEVFASFESNTTSPPVDDITNSTSSCSNNKTFETKNSNQTPS